MSGLLPEWTAFGSSLSGDMAFGQTWDQFVGSHADPRSAMLELPGMLNRVVVSAEQFSRADVNAIFSTADVIRTHRDDADFCRRLRQTLGHRCCALYFPQCSTRTFVSFSLATQALGMMIEKIRDPEVSAQYKGESELDTLFALSELADLVIIREKGRHLIDRFAFEMLNRDSPTKIINAGTGGDQHPTQALLDLYTLRTRIDLHSGEFRRVAFVGDLKRSRTARSLSQILAIYPHVEQVFVAPDDLQMGTEVVEALSRAGVRTVQSGVLDDVVPAVDALYMMRIQDEYSDTSDDLRRQYEQYYLTPERVRKMNPNATVVHPLPRREEVPLEFDYDPRAAYWTAVNLGKIVRQALILTMFGVPRSSLG
jgi:aspartate carbamoyltransferase catalytic subunit